MPYDVQKFFELSIDMLCIAGMDGYFKKVNRAFEQTLGWPAAELLRRPFMDFVHPDDVKATLREVSRLVAGVPTISFENRYRCSDGTYRHLLWTSYPDAEAELLYAVARDVTEATHRQALTRRLANAVEQTDDTVIITDSRGAIEYVNAAFERTTGFTAEEVQGQTPRILKSGVHPPEFYRQLWAELREGHVFRGVVVNRKKGGQLYYAEQTITPIKDTEGLITHFVSVVKDITERKKREEQDLELRLASVVQQRLYPRETLHVEGFDIAGATFPAGAMNGDYFDFITLGDGSPAIAIGDVSGHGLGQALLMAETRAYLRSLSRDHSDVGEILSALGQLLSEDLQSNWFVSLLLVRLDARNRTIQYANAGHPSGHLLDQSGRIKSILESTGQLLGLPAEVSPNRTVRSSPPVQCECGDLLVLLTDGIKEALSPDGVIFGAERAVEVVGTRAGSPARVIIEELRGALRTFLEEAPQLDDFTVVACRCISGC